MVQIINDPTRGHISGRIGAGIGRGLADQLPKEIERGRLSEGLSKIGKDKNLSPFEQFAQLSSIPGITPQMIQSGSELLKQQGMRDSYRGRGRQELPQQGPRASQSIRDTQFQGGQPNNQPQRKEQNLPSDYQTEEAAATATPGIIGGSVARPEAQPVAPWTPDRVREEVGNLLDEYPSMTVPEAQAMAKENEQRYLSQPEAQRKLDERQIENRNLAYAEFDRQLEETLHARKKGEGGKDETLSKLPGELQAGLKKQMEKDIRDGMPHDQAASKWVKKASNQVKAKSELDALANQNWIDKLDNKTTRS